MKSKALLFTGIIILILGIVVRKTTAMAIPGLALIIVGVTLKTTYIILKAKSGEYEPGKELLFLAFGLSIFFYGLHLRDVENAFIKPIFPILLGISLKVIYIIRFSQIVKSANKLLGVT